MFTAVARDQRWPDVVARISERFSKVASVLFCYITNHLMTGPLGYSEFCFPRISMFPSTLSREKLRFSVNISLRPGACEKLKEHAIERGTSDPFLFLICIMSAELTEHYNVINQLRIIFWTRMLLLTVSQCKLSSIITRAHLQNGSYQPVGLVSLYWVT